MQNVDLNHDLERLGALLAVSGGPSQERIVAAARAACLSIAKLTVGDAQCALATRDFLGALEAMGAEYLAQADPQALEDTCLRLNPDTCLDESVLRRSWLALSDELARTGHEPEFEGIGRLEGWVESATARSYPFVDLGGCADAVLKMAGDGVRVVFLKGRGADAVLAQIRRKVLSERPDVYCPAITSAAQETMGHLLRIGQQTPSLPDPLGSAIKRVEYGEDFIGILGRVGRTQPVSFILKDVHLCSRSILLGLPLFLEPDAERNALLVLGTESEDVSGPLEEILAEAERREILTRLDIPMMTRRDLGEMAQTVPSLKMMSQETVDDLWTAYEDSTKTPGETRSILMAHALGPDGVQRFTSTEMLRAVFSELSQPVKRFLATAALEGQDFHLAAVASVMDMEPDTAEDILLDEDFELDGERLGGAGGFVALETLRWAPAKEGVTSILSFTSERAMEVALGHLDEDDRKSAAASLEAALWETFDVISLVHVASTLWRLAAWTGNRAAVQRACLGPSEHGRVEVAFKRLLPVLGLDKIYHLGLQRLYSAAMERGGLMNAMGNAPDADHSFQVAAAAAQRLGQKGSAGEALARLAELRIALALPGPASAALDLASQLLESEKLSSSGSRLNLLKAEVEFLQGKYAEGCSILRACAERLEAEQDWGHLCLALSRLGRIAFAMGLESESEDVLGRAIEIADRSREVRAIGGSRLARAFVHAQKDELKEALLMLNQGAHAFSQASLPLHVFELAAAELQRRAGGADEAEERFAAVASQFRDMNAAIQHADAVEGRARCQMDQGNYSDASAALDDLVELRVRARDRLGLVRLYMTQVRAKEGCADPIGAFRFACMARALGQRCGFSPVAVAMDAVITRLAPDVDQVSDASPESLGREAVSIIDALEASWNAPPQVAEPNKTVH